MIVLEFLDSARALFPVCCGCAQCRFRLRGRGGITSGILHHVFGLAPVPESLKILQICWLVGIRFRTARAKFDKRERIEDCACKDATTTWSASISRTSSGTVTLGVTYGTYYLRFLSARVVSLGNNIGVPTPVMMTTANNPAMQPVMA